MYRIYKPNNRYEILNCEPAGGYTEMYIHDNAVAETITLQNTFYKVTDTWLAGTDSGFTIDTSNSRVICQTPGTYQFNVQINYNGSNNEGYEFAIFINDIQEDSLTVHTDVRQTTQTISCPIIGLADLNIGDVVDLRVSCTTNTGTQITVVHVNLNICAIFGK